MADVVLEGLNQEPKVLKGADNVKGDNSGGLFLVLYRGSSNEQAWDLGYGGEFKIGEEKFFSHFLASNSVVACKEPELDGLGPLGFESERRQE